MFANKPREEQTLWLAAALCLTFIANQYLWLLNFTYISSAAIGLSISTALFLAIRSARGNPQVAFVLLVCGFLAITALGAATTAWDARSIWLFHAKRIYVDDHLLAQLDNYAAFSHNDYPVMLPALSATLARIAGHWNEIFPKAGNVFFILPPLLVIAVTLGSLRLTLLFVTGLFLVVGGLLTNGFMDGILSLYMVATMMLLSMLFLGWQANLKVSKSTLSVAAMAHLAVLTGIKNEGTMAAVIMLFCLLLTLAIDKKRIDISKLLLVFTPAFIMTGLWLLLCHLHGIGNDIAAGGSFMGTFTARITDVKSVGLISIALYYQKWLLFLPLAIWSIHAYQKKQKTVDAASFLLRFGLLYSFSLFLIYLGSPHDLEWHLATSAGRTMLPVTLTFMTCFLMLFAENTAIRTPAD